MILGYSPDATSVGEQISRISLLIVDGDEPERARLLASLRKEVDIRVVGSTGSGTVGLQLAQIYRPRVTLVGSYIAASSVEDFCRAIVELDNLAVVVLIQGGRTASETVPFAHASVKRDVGIKSFVSTVRGLAASASDRRLSSRDPSPATFRKTETHPHVITPRQLEVARLAADGLNYPEIAELMKISESTVRFHVQCLKRNLGTRNLVEAVALLARRGQLEPRGAPSEQTPDNRE